MRRTVSELVSLADGVELFQTPQQIGFASFEVGGHRETWPIHSPTFANYLRRAHYVKTNEACTRQDIKEAQNILAAKAQFNSPVYPVFVRVGEVGGRIYLDLGNPSWQAVAVDSTGWSLEDRPAVRFQRPQGMQALPEPQRGGCISDLRPFVNLEHESDWNLLEGFLVSACRPTGPFPICQLLGEQGTAKTTLARILASLIDPKDADFRGEPHSAQDLMIAASQSWLLCFDNLSHISSWLSDALCRLSTGGGFATRKLHSDTDQIMLQAQRPVVLTGIAELSSRGDLLERSIVFELSPIAPEQRRTEQELWKEFEEVRPRILGALLDGVAGALRNLPNTQLSKYPRMADFVRWGTAAEEALHLPTGSLAESYEHNHAAFNNSALEASPITAPVMALLAHQGSWQGTASSLLRALTEEADEGLVSQWAWPRNPKMLSDVLRRLAPNLRSAGVSVEFSRATDRRRTRIIYLAAASAASAASATDAPEGAAALSPGATGRHNLGQAVQAAAAAELLNSAIAETKAVVGKAKDNGDLKTWAAGARELRVLAHEVGRGEIVPRQQQDPVLQEIGAYDNEQLQRFTEEHAARLGFRPAEPADDRARNGGNDVPAGKTGPH